MFDEIGYWSEIKLEIVKKYASAYSTILTRKGFWHVYIDAFAGSGLNISRKTGKYILGSPLTALLVEPPFREFHFIDLDRKKVKNLRKEAEKREDVFVYEGDCNKILMEKVFPKVNYKEYRRGLCLLDPYTLNYNWEIIKTAGSMKSIELFINFPAMAINRVILRRDFERISDKQVERMNAFWGDNSWTEVAYSEEQSLFGPVKKKAPIENVLKGYCDRLRKVACFKYISNPMPMRYEGKIIYYLIFTSQQPVAINIVDDIMSVYRGRDG